MAEIDFILADELEVYPLEVKAGASAHKKSLLSYKEKYHPQLLLRATLMNLKQDGIVCNYPLYLTERIPIKDVKFDKAKSASTKNLNNRTIGAGSGRKKRCGIP